MNRAAPFLLLLLLLPLVPGTVAATGQQCDTHTVDPSGSGLLIVQWCGPSEASIGDDFMVSVNVQGAGTGLLLESQAPSAWESVGCSYDSIATSGSGLLNEYVVAVFTMEEPTCTIAGEVVLAPIIGADVAALAFFFAIYDPTATLPVDFNNNVEGHLDLDVLTWPDLNAYIQEWPELFASVTIDGWADLVAAIQSLQNLNATLAGTLDVNAILSGMIAADLSGELNSHVDGDLNSHVDGDLNSHVDGSLVVSGEVDAHVDGTLGLTGVEIAIENQTIGNVTFEDNGFLVNRKTDQGDMVDPVLPILFVLAFAAFSRMAWPVSAVVSLMAGFSVVVTPWPLPWEWWVTIILLAMFLDTVVAKDWWADRQARRKPNDRT